MQQSAGHLGAEGAVLDCSVDLQLHLNVVARRRFHNARDARRQQLRNGVRNQRLHTRLPLYREGCGASAGVLQKRALSQLLPSEAGQFRRPAGEVTAPLYVGMGAHEPLVQVVHVPDKSALQQHDSPPYT